MHVREQGNGVCIYNDLIRFRLSCLSVPLYPQPLHSSNDACVRMQSQTPSGDKVPDWSEGSPLR